MPQTYERQLQRDRVHERLGATDQDYVATVGHKLELDVEVLENRYSRKWSTYYVTVIDTENRAWYFAYRSGLKKGEKFTIRGTVKRQADGMVQLNRVKLINGGNSD
jgi:spore coat polysaccharide biosynthesis protein SpsF (cytidylyltransferase family)